MLEVNLRHRTGNALWGDERPEAVFVQRPHRSSTAKIVKESEDGVVSGLQFRITGNGIDKTYTTDSKGTDHRYPPGWHLYGDGDQHAGAVQCPPQPVDHHPPTAGRQP